MIAESVEKRKREQIKLFSYLDLEVFSAMKGLTISLGLYSALIDRSISSSVVVRCVEGEKLLFSSEDRFQRHFSSLEIRQLLMMSKY